MGLDLVHNGLLFHQCDGAKQGSPHEDPQSPHYGFLVISLVEERFPWQLASGWTPAQWQEVIKVIPLMDRQQEVSELPGMLGQYEAGIDSIFFKPRFPWTPGQKYLVQYQYRTGAVLTSMFTAPVLQEQSSYPAVEAIYPSSGQLPENLLKCYIYFATPMGLHTAYEHFVLYDDQGVPVPEPFLPLEPPLWDQERRRLTLWFQPGRIKTGLIPNERLGPPLQAGRRYQLVIKETLKDGRGNPLGREFVKEFDVVAADRRQPQPRQWEIQVPRAGTSLALQVVMGEPIDHALLGRSLVILDENLESVPGMMEAAQNESIWRFQPQQPWQAGSYILRVAAELEDLAGNSVKRLFDRDITNSLPVGQGLEFVDLTFMIINPD